MQCNAVQCNMLHCDSVSFHAMQIETFQHHIQYCNAVWPPLQSGGVKHALNPDPYRGRFGNDGPAYAEDVRDLIQTATSGQVAGFLSETIQGVGGATPLADGYLPEAYKV